MIATTAKFALGQIVATPNALGTVSKEEITRSIQRHRTGDWGDVSGEDRQANDLALIDGSRLFSVYHTKADVKYWIITESDRSVTTVLLPEDY